MILFMSEYSDTYFYRLFTSAENLPSNLFLISISVLVKESEREKKEKQQSAKHFIHECTVHYVNAQQRMHVYS